MSFLDQLLSPKVRARVVVSGVSSENGHMIKNSIQTWGLPGRIRMSSAGMMDIEVEGRQTTVNSKLDILAKHPLLAGKSMQVQWLAYTGTYTYMMVSF